MLGGGLMYCYKISEFYIQSSKEKDFEIIHDMDKDGNDKIVKVNPQFKVANDLLNNIFYNIEQGEIIVHYKEGVLNYYIISDTEFNNFPSGCKFKLITTENSQVKALRNSIRYTSISKLKGGIPIECIEDKQTNCIDTIITSMPDSSFTLSFKFSNKQDPTQYSWGKRKSDLSTKIKESKKSSKISVHKNKNIISEGVKTLVGGENKNYEVFDITESFESAILEKEFYAIQMPCVYADCIDITAPEDTTCKKIANYLIQLSNSASDIEGNFKLYDQNYAPRHLAPWIPISYITPIFAFPSASTPGIKQTENVYFSSDIRENVTDTDLTLGNYIRQDVTNIKVPFDVNELTKHAFITGVTGSGKTTTIKHLLEQISSKKIPFLVLEPAKNEYRNLNINNIPINKYRLGSKNSGLKINPFYFPEGMHIQTHIDHIKSIFVAAFPMYGPMPYILETAIYNIYRNKGWDIVTSKTIRKHDKYPTLEDLLYEIDEATELAGYSDDLQNDVKGALKVRINSLITGAKGNILNCDNTDSIGKIITESTVISLEGIGDSQEKVFFMGLILISMYEYYISQNIYSDKLKNLLVFEEAHRLLENAQANNNPEIADMKGKALETFNNILSEIRAYGQGIIVADQIPSKISPDVVKNTNLKIAHRLFAKDDRELIGNSIGLNQKQIDNLLHLNTGEAIVFHSQIDDAIKVKVNAENIGVSNSPSDENTANGEEAFCGYSVTDNPEFVNECIKWLNTALLLDLDEKAFHQNLVQIAKDFGSPDGTFDLQTLWKRITRIFLNETNLLKLCEHSYAMRLKRVDKISENPYPELIKLSKQFITESPDEFEEPKAALYKLLAQKVNYESAILNNPNIIQNDTVVYNAKELINVSQCNKFLAVYLLDEKQYETISDCIICLVYQDHPNIRGNYFGTLDKEYISELPREYDLIQQHDGNFDALVALQQKLCKTLDNYVGTTNDLSNKILKSLSSNKTKYLPFGIIGALEAIIAVLLIISNM